MWVSTLCYSSLGSWYKHVHTYSIVCQWVLFLRYVYFYLHDFKASSFRIPRLYATGLGNVSVSRHEVTYIWQCCFFVLLSKMTLFMLDVPRLYATGLGNVSVFWHEVITSGNAVSLYIWATIVLCLMYLDCTLLDWVM
jgi:hypothetical protein